jgi:DNA modification methylase
MSEQNKTDTTNAASAQSIRDAGILHITHAELVWPGKYDANGDRRQPPRVNLPFQVIETINESRATRETEKAKGKTLFDFYAGNEGETFEAGWKNKLIWGDNALVMSSLLEKFAGKIDLIYIDPPFATGADFSFTTQIGDDDMELTKEQSILEEKAYRDTWGRGADSYLSMLSDRLHLMRELLSPRGSIYVHLDWHYVHAVRHLLDEVFGPDNFINEIVRVKSNPKNFPQPQFGNYHDTILFYAVNRDAKIWHPPTQALSDDQRLRDFPFVEAKTGRRYKTDPLHAPGIRFGVTGDPWKGLRPPPGRHWAYVPEALNEFEKKGQIEWSSKGNPRLKTFADQCDGYPFQDIWTEFKDPVRKDYATEKNDDLLRLIINSSSDSGSLVADFFCGSGTTLAVAEGLGRRWIGADLGRFAMHISRKRLLEIEGCKRFEILNLGKYERQYWQGITFGINGRNITEKAIYEYLAFILRLYGAQPVSGMAHLHGKKGRSMVHIGSVDAPVTIDEISGSLTECIQVKQTELHVLGWEWEMGLYDLMVDEAKKQGMKLLLLNIPREVMEQQAVDKGDIQFFELAYLEADIKRPKKLTVSVKLKDFVIPNTELVPEEIRSKVKKWSDYIDYWGVDWNFQNDTFMQGWVAYRTVQQRISLWSE